MTLDTLALQLLNGLASAASLFLVSSGLTIIFGVTRIVNFAHGSLYMLGAFIAYTLVGLMPATGAGFWLAVALAALAVGLIGALWEMAVMRRIYGAPEIFQLLASFGLVLIVADLALAIWGPEELLGPRVPGLRGAVLILGGRFPSYDLALIGLGAAVGLGLFALFRRTRWGVLVRAATRDREMVAALGVDQRRLFTTAFFVGAALAGLAGALQVPRASANLGMDLGIITEAFVVVVVGGLGSIPGAALASVLIGVLQAFGILLIPELSLVLVFLVMAVVLVIKPHGLLGRAEETRPGAPPGAGYAPSGRRGRLVMIALILALASLPLWLGDYGLAVATETLILALFAASLHFLAGPGGMISFGHAAYFGLGAYGAALAAQRLGLPMLPSIGAGMALGGAGAVVFGWFCVRLSGVYLAMLTLAFAQIVWSLAVSSTEWTGGDNGLIGLRPAAWIGGKPEMFLFTLLLAGAAVALLRRIVFSPFGRGLRAVRDSPRRARASGIDPRAQQWLGFALAGAAAGLAGGLYAFAQGSVFPQGLSVGQSLDGLVMVLLGGIGALAGPLVGAAAYHGLEVEVMGLTEHWRAILGLIILALVLAFPDGIAGAARRLGGAIA